MPDHIEDFFKGNISELKEIFGYQPENEVKLSYYVKTNTADNKQYQQVYMKMPMRNSVTASNGAYTKLKDEVTNAQNRGSLPNCEFDFGELHEYVVVPTTFTPSGIMPEAAPMTSPWGGTSPV
jgi:hypothetical protein